MSTRRNSKLTPSWASAPLWVEPIQPDLRARAIAALKEGDVLGFLLFASNEYSLDLVHLNGVTLLDLGLYERALLHAIIATRTNNAAWPLPILKSMLMEADPGELRAAGTPLPGPGPFTVYRGVSGKGSARRVSGIHPLTNHVGLRRGMTWGTRQCTA